MGLPFKKSVLGWGLFLLLSQYSFSQNPLETKHEIIKKSFSQQWELDSIDRCGTFRLVSYKPIYVTAGRWSSKPNQFPVSENPEYSSINQQDYNNYEAKFQLSFKTKVLQSIFWGEGDLWLAYTQRAHWQIYNTTLSRAFRELNYEPEFILNFPLNIELFGGRLKRAGIAFNHQSNGRALPLSRSWNRIIFNLGYEAGNWQVELRPWIRLSDDDDENPEITKYVGNGELDLGYEYNRHEFYAIVTHPFNTMKYGSLQLNYVFPIEGHIRGHVQFFHGYGETMIDYNHEQTTLGIGISFANW
jgi:phospholipase A1